MYVCVYIYIYIHLHILNIPELLTQLITCCILSDYDLDNNIVSQKLNIGEKIYFQE